MSIALPPPAFVIYRSLPRQGERWRTCMRSCGLDAVYLRCSPAAEGKRDDQHEAALLLSSQECLQFLRVDPTGALSISNVPLSHTPSRANNTAQGPESMTFPDAVECNLAGVALHIHQNALEQSVPSHGACQTRSYTVTPHQCTPLFVL